MKDTSSATEKIYTDMLLRLPGEKRFIMGALMFDAAREMVIASFPEGLSASEIKINLLQRFYAADLDQRQLNEITEFFEGRKVKANDHEIR
jgi:hypothetical protein